MESWAIQSVGGKTINFPSTITTVHNYVFGSNCTGTILNIDRAENTIPGAPWGCAGLTINWNGTK